MSWLFAIPVYRCYCNALMRIQDSLFLFRLARAAPSPSPGPQTLKSMHSRRDSKPTRV